MGAPFLRNRRSVLSEFALVRPYRTFSQFWVYYKPSKVTDVYNYLTREYIAAENESTEYVYVFYNDSKDLKVVLDQINGAVVYTKLDMKQHETPV